MRIHVQNERCRECEACGLACSLYHEGECSLSLARLLVTKNMARYEFEIQICRHCESPKCQQACPTGAMQTDERGVILIVDADCTRCGSCAASCPYGAIFHEEAHDRYLKCDLCAGNEKGPLCVALCAVEALTLGD